MKVFRPIETNHILKVIPRFTDIERVEITIRHELKDATDIVISYDFNFVNGYLYTNFEYKFKEGASYQITCNYLTNLIWRGKAYATDKVELENYKLHE